MSPTSSNTIERRPGAIVVRIQAERLDAAHIQQLAADLGATLAHSPEAGVALDFSQVRLLLEDALGTLVTIYAELRSRYHQLALFGLQPAVVQSLAATRLDRMLPIYGDELAALLALAAMPGKPAAPVGVTPAHYMKFVAGHHGSLDRIGGLPTHLPPAFPMVIPAAPEPSARKRGRRRQQQHTPPEPFPMAFTAQFYCTPERLPLPGALCVQIYQPDPGDDPWPTAVVVPVGAPENVAGLGRVNAEVIPHDIQWEYRDDPAERPDDPFDPACRTLMESKADGTSFFTDALHPGDQFLLQLRDDRLGQVHGVNFGGHTLLLVLKENGVVEARLA